MDQKRPGILKIRYVVTKDHWVISNSPTGMNGVYSKLQHWSSTKKNTKFKPSRSLPSSQFFQSYTSLPKWCLRVNQGGSDPSPRWDVWKVMWMNIKKNVWNHQPKKGGSSTLGAGFNQSIFKKSLSKRVDLPQILEWQNNRNISRPRLAIVHWKESHSMHGNGIFTFSFRIPSG